MTPAQVNSLLSSLPKLTHLSIEVNNIKMCIPLLPALGQLSQLVINSERHIEDFVTAWASNGYKPQFLILICSHLEGHAQYNSLLVSPHPATLSIYRKKRGPLDLCILKPIRYFEIEAGKGFEPHKHARSNDLDDVKSLAASYDPTLAREEKRIVALPRGFSLTNYGTPLEYSFTDFASIITSIDIYFFPPGALSYVAHHCPKLQELRIGLADDYGSLPADLLEGLSDISRECKELMGLNVLQLHASILKVSAVSFWKVVSRMSHLTHLGVPYCLLLPSSVPGSLDDGQFQAIEELAPKRRCVNANPTEVIRRAIMSLQNVKAIQIQAITGFRGHCELCYDFIELQFSLAVCETLSAFNSLQYVYFEEVKIDIDCLLSNCKGIQYLSFHQCSISLPQKMSSLANIQQLHLCGGHNLDLAKVADILASAVNLTHLSLAELPEVSVEKVYVLIQKVPSLVFLQIVCQYSCSKSLVREITQNINIFVKSIKRSYLEFQCCLGYEMLDNTDIYRLFDPVYRYIVI